MKQALFWLPLSLAFLVSPEIQAVLGNSVGMIGVYVYPLLLVVAGLAFLIMRSYGDVPDGEFLLLRRHYGVWLSLSSLLVSRVVFFVTGSTIVLATSGYVFNEVFVSAFPNFGFAFLLLGLVLVVNLCGPVCARRAQVFFVSLWFGSLLYAAGCGIGAEAHPEAGGDVAFAYRGIFLPILLLIGVDLGLVQRLNQDSKVQYKLLWTGFLLILVLLGAWAWTMGKMVPFDVLAASYIPHMKAAHRLLGDAGRNVLGLAMIAGTFAMVNGLLQVLVAQMHDVCLHTSLPKSWGRSGFFARVFVVVLGCSPGVMMAQGMAGYEITEVYLRGSLIFWLLHYGLMSGIALRQGQGVWPWLHGGAIVLLVTGASGLIYFDPDFRQLSFAMGCMLGSAVFCAGVVSLFMNKKEVLRG